MERILRQIKLFFTPKNRHIHVVLEGKLKGEWLVEMKRDEKEITFFSLPDKYIRTVPIKDYTWGLQNKVIERVDALPKQVYNTCVAEYNYKITDVNNPSNRRKQHSPSSSPDSE